MPRKAKEPESSDASKETVSKVTSASKAKSTKTVEEKVKKTVAKKTVSPKKNTTKKEVSPKDSSSAKTTSKSDVSKRATTKTSKTTSVTKKATSKSTAKKASATTAKKKTATKKVTSKKESNYIDVLEYYDLPYRYNQTVVKILAQTPNTLFVYWDISDDDRNRFAKDFGENFFNDTFPVLLIRNKTMNYCFEIEINDFCNSWYFNVNDTSCEYEIELGRKSRTAEITFPNNYMQIVASNIIETPNNHILFEKEQRTIYFRNVKTNNVYSRDIATLEFMNRIGRIYKLNEIYKKVYKFTDSYKYNPSSSNNPSSNMF